MADDQLKVMFFDINGTGDLTERIVVPDQQDGRVGWVLSGTPSPLIVDVPDDTTHIFDQTGVVVIDEKSADFPEF